MISKKLRMGGATLALSMALLMGSSVSAYANVPDGVDTTGTTETTQAATAESTAESATESAVSAEEGGDAASEGRVTGTENEGQTTESGDGVLTPSGNMSLVDNVGEADKENMDFMTVNSKDGHVFYIVIDHSSNADNVYFLNQVDESDLMALMSDEEKEAIEENKEEAAREDEKAVTPNVKTDSGEINADQAEVPEKGGTVKNAMNNNLIMGAVFGVLGLLLIGGYYFLKIRPKKGASSIEDDLEFYDDEEYVNEDDADAEPQFEDGTNGTRHGPDQGEDSSEEDPEKGAHE